MIKAFVKTLNEMQDDITYSQKDCVMILNALQKTACDALVEGKDVRVFDGLTLYVKELNERNVRNPLTGETFVKPAHKVVKTKLGKSLKELF